MLAFSPHQKTRGNSSAHYTLFNLQYFFTHSVFEDHPTVNASCKTNFGIFCTSRLAVYWSDLQVKAATQQALSFMSQAELAKGFKVLAALAKQFVPEDGISRAVLEDKLHVYFPKGARIERRIRLTPGGPPGWFIAGGIVTDSIIEALQRDTLRETDPSSYRSIRDAELACEEAVSSNPIQGGLNSFLSDRHRAPQIPPPRSSFSSPDENPTFSPTGTRHQKIDWNNPPPRKTVSFAHPATAVRYPGREHYTEENFEDFQAWKEYLRLKAQSKNANRHQNVTTSSVVPAPPHYQPVDVAANSRQPQSGRGAGERNKDASAPLGDIQTQGRHARHNKDDRPMENGEDGDSDDEPPRRRRPAVRRRRHRDYSDSDSDSDVILQEVVRKTPWSKTVTTTTVGGGGHSSRRRRGGRETTYIWYER